MPKLLLFGPQARAALMRGVSQLAEAVAGTLGPKGSNVLLDRPIGSPMVSRDGASIAEEIELEDRFENMGAQLVRETAQKTNEVAGDGTTTATLLAYALMREGLKALEEGATAVDLIAGIEAGISALQDRLQEMAIPADLETLHHVAQIAAKDERLAACIQEAIGYVGVDGAIEVDTSDTSESYVHFVAGYSFDRGYLSPHMVTDASNQEAVLENAAILLTDQPIRSIGQLTTLLAEAKRAGLPLLLIADEIAPPAIAAILSQQQPADPPVVAVLPPEYGMWRKAMLEDLAIYTGGKLFAADLGRLPEQATLEELGHAERVRVTADETIIEGGGGEPEAIRGRRELIKRQLSQTQAPIENDKLTMRLSRLAGGLVEVRVGGRTRTEQRQRVQRAEDALHAVRAAMEEGVVAGGGAALIHACEALEELEASTESGVRQGIATLRAALSYPLATIAQSSGAIASEVIAQVAASTVTTGYDAVRRQCCDLLEAGIVDPAKVVKVALQNAASIATLLLSTNVLVVDRADDIDFTAEPARGGGAEKLGMQ